MSHFAIDNIVAEIRKRGGLRTPGLALVFHMSEPQLDAALEPLCATGGPLISCDVEVAGKRVKEYRASTIGGGKLNDTFTTAPGRPRRAVEPKANPAFGSARAVTQALAARFQKPTATWPVSKEEHHMKTPAKILTAFRERGPMRLAELRQRVGGDLTPQLAKLCASGEVVRLGGRTRSTIYGLPGQKVLAAQQDKAAPAEPAAGSEEQHIGGIEVGVPVPSNTRGILRRAIEEMQPGESRVIRGCSYKNIYSAAEKGGVRIRVRRGGDGFRVWRIS